MAPSSGLRAEFIAALVSMPLVLAGCGSFAFYEVSKVGINITVDPKAPDPVEISAAFKEQVFALVPLKAETTDGKVVIYVGPVLSDFDVRYGANAGVKNSPGHDFLYAAITHGVATGSAASTLASGRTGPDQARRMVIVNFLRQLSDSDMKVAASKLGLAGLGSPDTATLRIRTIAATYASQPADIKTIEDALAAQFPNTFRAWVSP